MNFRDSNPGAQEAKYISKRVMINGQYVTLYSSNGQTWLSSPEDLPALMERLENARITLNTAEKVAEGEGIKAAKSDSDDKEKKEDKEKEQPEKVMQTKYRLKGPKPRPILRQDGVVIKGTPIEPVSASNTIVTFSSDQAEEVDEKVAKGSKDSKQKEVLAAKKGVKVAAKAAVKQAVKAAPKGHEKAVKAGSVTAKSPASKVAAKAAQATSKVTPPKAVKKLASKPTPNVQKAAAKKAPAKGAKPAPKASKKASSVKKPAAKGKKAR